jgi:hypothetical protein
MTSYEDLKQRASDEIKIYVRLQSQLLNDSVGSREKVFFDELYQIEAADVPTLEIKKASLEIDIPVDSLVRKCLDSAFLALVQYRLDMAAVSAARNKVPLRAASSGGSDIQQTEEVDDEEKLS